MEKLIELLNGAKPLKKYKEYWYRGNEIYLITYAEDYGASESRNITLDVISKSFGFVKWLVENDKIDLDKVLISFSMTERDGLGNYYGHGVDDNQRLLMILAISDTPIEDLVSYLK